MAGRAPLRYIILSATGQDVNKCTACRCCFIDEALEARFDMPVWEVMAAARKNELSALTNRTIWVLAETDPDSMPCANGVNVLAIAKVLRDEARRRGLDKNVVEYK
jgi:heterodisulfide reductase subunit C